MQPPHFNEWDEVAEDLNERILPRLVALADLRSSETVIVDGLRGLLDISRGFGSGGTSNRSSTLTGGNYPVELSLSFDGGRVAALTYTVDLFACDSRASLLDAINRAADSVMGRAERKQLEACLRTLWDTGDDNIFAGYVSVTHTQRAASRFKVHVVGRDAAFSSALLARLVPAVVNAQALDALTRATKALGAESANFIGFGIAGSRITRCKGYVGTQYIDLRAVTRLSVDMELPVGHAISLVRWYRRFVGKHWGQLGAFGVGVDLMSAPRSNGLEAYAYPSRWHIQEMRESLERRAGDLSPLWSLTTANDSSHAASLYLAGCGVQTAPSGRLGRTTAYFGVQERARGR